MGKNVKAGIILLGAAVLSWASAPVFIHYFTGIFDQWTQNFFRYLAGTCVLWAISLLFFRQDIRKALPAAGAFVLPVVVNVVFQIIWVIGLKYIEPAFASLVTKTSVIFAAMLAFVFHAEERAGISDPRYIFGTLLALGGCAALILGGDIGSRIFLKGVLLLVIASLGWALYIVIIKKLLHRINPVVVFTMISTGTTALFFVFVLLWGRPKVFFSSPPLVKLMLVFSGVLCIAGAHTLYYFGVRIMGVAVSASFTLTQPLFTGMISYLAFSEVLNPVQLVSGVVIIAGSYFVVNASRER